MLDSLDTVIAFVVIMLVVSLLITIAVQIAAAALNLRGFNLAQGLKRSFAVIVPTTLDAQSEANAKKLANFILKGCFLSDSFLPDWPILRWWRHATAIRPDEVFDAINRIAIGKEPVGEHSTVRESARRILVALGVDESALDSAAAEVGAVQQGTADFAAKVLKLLPAADQPQAQADLKLLSDRLMAAGQAVVTQVTSATDRMEAARKKFADWAFTSQERAQQWVTMHTRILTVIFAFLAAFGLQLDTVEIFKLVSTNRAVREKLVAQTAAVTGQAENILGESQGVLQKALADWRKGLNDEKAKQAVASISVTPADSRAQLRDRVEKALSDSAVPDVPNLLADLDQAIDAAAWDNLNTNAKAYSTVKPDLDKTGFDLFVADPKGRWGQGPWSPRPGHTLGILFSAALLSLGAPFWYHSLKNLTSLRSTVAQNIAEEKDQANKAPPAKQ